MSAQRIALCALLPLAALALQGCSASALSSLAAPAAVVEARAADARSTPEIDGLIARYAAEYNVPAALVHRVVAKESGYNPFARNGPYYGLMQILPATARTMGYRGEPAGLLDPDTNLRYGVKYLAGAWMVSKGSHDGAMGFYSRGYYYDAKRMGLLEETGLR